MHTDTEHVLVSSVISRRRLLASFLAVPAVGGFMAACGKASTTSTPSTTPDTSVPPSTTPSTTPGTGTPGTGTPATTPPDGGFTHPMQGTELVIRLGYLGGFVAPDYLFSRLPTMVISGDGHVYTPGVMTMQYPGPLVPPLNVRTISEAGIQTLLKRADTDQLLGPAPDYTAETMIADAPSTEVVIATQGSTYTHNAYALGMTPDGGKELTPARQRLFDFSTALQALEATVGAGELGEQSLYAPAAYRIRARRAEQSELDGMMPAPSVVDWPASVGVRLADAAECVSVTAAQVGSVLAEAKQNTYFREDGVLYFLAVAPILPGDTPC
jgi:hypothetical protein